MKTKLLFISAIILVLSSCGNNPQQKKTKPTSEPAKQEIETMEKQLSFDPAGFDEEPVLAIETSKGVITIKLSKETPKHRDNFVKLASEGFYNGLIFHRVIDGFMIQGGDPNSRNPKPDAHYGMGGPGYLIPAEITPQLKHKKGAIAAARTNNPEKASSGSQFYIVQNANTCAQLDGEYTVFGETLSGLDVVDEIAKVTTGPNDRPVEDVFIINIQPVKE
jgi:peptidyl-prolyl cis-trans isomerase B (cyclophilin B)